MPVAIRTQMKSGVLAQQIPVRLCDAVEGMHPCDVVRSQAAHFTAGCAPTPVYNMVEQCVRFSNSGGYRNERTLRKGRVFGGIRKQDGLADAHHSYRRCRRFRRLRGYGG